MDLSKLPLKLRYSSKEVELLRDFWIPLLSNSIIYKRGVGYFRSNYLALMAFFFGLSKYLKHNIPYIIDDPLIRLDPGHNKRLINQLSKGEQQIIMHMLPSNEYREETFGWLRPNINTQNWINREKDKRSLHEKSKSFIEQKDHDRFLKYDIDRL